MSLHAEAVSPMLLATVRSLAEDACLKDFFLVGGTSLALRFGHRVSVDIDMFTAGAFEVTALAEHLRANLGLDGISVAKNSVTGFINGIKSDFIAHQYPMLSPIERVDGIPMASLPDVAAMMLNAITNRGSKKDFRDYALLLEVYPHGEMLGFFRQKYAPFNLWHVEKSLCYFDDAELESDLQELAGVTWEDVKAKIRSVSR
jgi:hypothetical protein